MTRTVSASFADLLKQYRAAAGMTQEELAERAELSARAVSDLERGLTHRPYAHTVQRLIQSLALDEKNAALLQTAARQPGSESAESAADIRQSVILPLQATAFIGRLREMEEVRSLIGRDDVRLLTLTGLGGVGKTRLGLRLAEEVAPGFSDGVVFVSLASLADPGLVPATIASTLGVGDAGGRPILETLVEHFRTRQVLLVVDNFEHLLPAGEAVAHLLASCPQLKLLTTSRAVLHLSAEHEYSVPPLALPDFGHLPGIVTLSRYDSVQLFLQRAEAIKPGFRMTEENATAIVEICSRLDGLPLAIELAAARIRLFPPHALLERLSDHLGVLTGGAKDLPPRQQTLRNTLDWSYALLSPDEQTLLARLSVFAGGCTFEAAEAVCSLDGALDLLEGMTSLVEQSLVRQQEQHGAAPHEPRFVMLETVRQYAREKLDILGEAANVRRRHTAYFQALADRAEPAMWGGPVQRSWLARLEAEHNNLRAALAWAEEAGDETLRLQFVGALGRFWFIRGHSTEGRRRLEQALDSTPAADAFLRARALFALGNITRQQGEPASCVIHLEEALALFRTLGDERWTALTLFGLGGAWRDLGDWRQAMELLEASLALSQGRRGDWGFVRGLPLVIFGWLLLDVGDRPRAVAVLEEALTLGGEVGDKVAIGTALVGLGWAAHYAGDDVRGIALMEEALALVRELGHHYGTLAALASLGWVTLHCGDTERAVGFFREGLASAHERAYRAHAADCLRGLGAAAGYRGEIEQAAELYGAAERYGAVERLQEAASAPPYPASAAYQRALAATRAQLDDAAWEEAWEAGRMRPVRDTIAAALATGQAPKAL